MAEKNRLDRRAFLRNAGIGVLASAVGSHTAVEAGVPPLVLPQDAGYDFDTVYDRIGTDCSKWDAQIARYGHIDVGMGTADQDFKIAPPITQALRERVAHENYGYLTIPSSYVESIVDWNRRRYGLEIDPTLLMHSDGVHPAIISTLRAFCPKGTKVLVQPPVYSGFYTDIRIVGCIAEESPLTLVNGRYAIDFDDLERRIDHDTHALLLCNPQNPTGNSWSRDDLMTLGEICARRRVVVLADEIHCDFATRGNTHTPFATLGDETIVRNSISFKSTSKSFNLSAMKCAYMFSTNADHMARVENVGQHRQSINTLGVVAAETAYSECDGWLDEVVSYIDGTMDEVETFVNSRMPLVSFVKPEGTYLAWLDCRELVDAIGAKETAAETNRAGDAEVTPETVLQRYLVDHAKVHMNPGSSYGYGGAGQMRMNIATSRQLVRLALTNMAEALSRVL